MPAFEWVHVQLHQQKGMISLSPPTICNTTYQATSPIPWEHINLTGEYRWPKP
ncbi:putative transposase [Escherichia coli 1-182-04_S1_C3]|nr:putative transposase [Escherichia coli 1-182-04_S1_C3]